MNKSQGLIKSYLKKFILQTHPDYFQRELTKKRTNAASLQGLYDVFQAPSRPSTCSLLFYLKRQTKPVRFEVNAKDNEWERAQTFLRLCEHSGIPVSVLDQRTVQQEIQQHAPPVSAKLPGQEFADQLYQEHAFLINQAWTPKDFLNNPWVLFDEQVPKDSSAQTLCHWLPYLQPERWWNKVPLIVVSDQNKSLQQTSNEVLIIPYNSSLEGLFPSASRLYPSAQ
ncbi:hypothetical protein BY458DRAFT_552409 [Sporodiniella umbellata]|nr:hypothetical protein BY458DRAFT_552409 [Sporodiniella umbellata]